MPKWSANTFRVPPCLECLSKRSGTWVAKKDLLEVEVWSYLKYRNINVPWNIEISWVRISLNAPWKLRESCCVDLALESSRRDLHKALLCTVLQSQNFSQKSSTFFRDWILKFGFCFNFFIEFCNFFCEYLMKFCPDFATNSRKEWRVSLVQSNLRKQIRKLPKILKWSVKIIHYYSLLFIRVLRRSSASARASSRASASRTGPWAPAPPRRATTYVFFQLPF